MMFAVSVITHGGMIIGENSAVTQLGTNGVLIANICKMNMAGIVLDAIVFMMKTLSVGMDFVQVMKILIIVH